LARVDFRATASARLNEERGQELSQNVLSLLNADESTVIRPSSVRNIPVDRVDPNPNQPRLAIDQAGLDDLTASVKEHGVLQPILVRPLPAGRYQLVAGERRWRAATAAGMETIPALIEDIDDETAIEISVIENLQREDLSPIDEAMIYDKMIRQHGYSIRKLAQKLGKDKGYLENRLSRGELSLVKLRAKIDEPPRAAHAPSTSADTKGAAAIEDATDAETDPNWQGTGSKRPISDDSLMAVRAQLADSMSELIAVIQSDILKTIDDTDRQNLIKFLVITRVRLENAIVLVRRGNPRT
jgi:ParB family chromosome partitioning protein